LYEVTEIIQTVKMKSLYFLYWSLMLVFLLSVCSDWQCVCYISEGCAYVWLHWACFVC